MVVEGRTDAVLLELRYGNKPIAIADNKGTFEVGAMDKLPKVIDMVIEAVSAGELDKVLKAALGERRVKLRQVSYSSILKLPRNWPSHCHAGVSH